MFKLRLYRDPGAEGGGAAPITAPAPSQQPVHNGPSSYGGSSIDQLWQDPLAPENQPQPQPPVTGNKTPAAPAAGEGGSQGQPAQGGQPPAPDTSSTAAAPGQAPAEVKGALSAEDKAYWAKKDPVYQDLPDHPAVAKLSSGYRELETAFNRSQGYLGTVNQTIEDYKAVLQSGDPAEIAKMVEFFGGEAHFDVRKPEDVIGEIKTNYDDLVKVFQAIAPDLDQNAVNVVNRALNAYAQQQTAKINGITDKQARRDEIRKEIARVTGVQQPKVGNPYERYKEPAKANMTSLEREYLDKGDSDFWAYYEAIKPEFAPGGMFHAQGLTAGKAFGSSLESARYYMELAKGRWLQKNMPSVLSKHEQAWLAKQKGNGAMGAPPKGAAPANAGQAPDAVIASMEAKMADHMKRHS